ncbi:MAG: hypothetical protein ABL998_04970 [Planctomycetota bacterium]
MNQDLIKKHVEDFAQKLDLLVRQSVLETLKGVLGQASGAVAAPKRGRPAGSGRGPGRPRGRRPADLGDALAKMVDYVKANDGQGISAIAAGTGIDLKVAKKAALQLLAAKALKKSGERRGTVYHVGSGNVPAADGAAPAKAKRGKRKA